MNGNFSLLFSNIMMKLSSSISSGGSNLMAGSFIENIGNTIINFFANLIYLICKWILYFLDVIFFYIRQLAGTDVDTSSLSSLTSADSDIVFNFLISNPNLVTQIIRQLFGLSLVVLVVMTIIAIVKVQYQAFMQNKPGDNTAVLKSTVKAIIIMIITPIIAIGGIVMSNVLIKALYTATNVTGASSLGSAVFSLSSSAANSYRIYATEGNRIPIYFNLDEHEGYLTQIENQEELTQKGIEYLTSEKNPAYKTHLLFENESYQSYEEIPLDSIAEADKLKVNEYYSIYDSPASAKTVSGTDTIQRIRSYREEYFLMADVIDYAVKTSQKIYFKTIEEVLNSYDAINLSFPYDLYDDGKTITFSSNLYSYDELNMSAGGRKQIKYEHKKGALDEVYGAVFIVAVEQTIVKDGVSYIYFEPFVEGYRQNNSSHPFDSDYVQEGNIIAAKGFFTSDLLPTAIKRNTTNTDVKFYRDSLEQYDLGNVDSIVKFYQEQEESENILTKIVDFFKSIANPANFISKLIFKQDAVIITYKKDTSEEGMLKEGALHISYMFNKTDDLLSTNKYSLNIKNFYVVRKLNFLILVMGSVMLFKACATAVFALIKRIYELFLLFIFYPTACSTMPLDGGAGYTKWMGSFVAKLFAANGLIIGINFVLMVVPIIETVEVFKPAEIGSTTALRRISQLFFGLISNAQMARMLNLVVALMFTLVAFSLLQKGGIVSLMSQLFPGEEDIGTEDPIAYISDFMGKVAKVTSAVTTVVGGIGGVGMAMFTKKGRAELLKKTTSKLERFVPMGKAVGSVKNSVYRFNLKRDQNKAFKEMKESLSSDDSKEEMSKKMEAFLKAQEKYTNALSGDDKTKEMRQADKAQKKDEKKKEQEAENSRDPNEESSGQENSGEGGGESQQPAMTDEEAEENSNISGRKIRKLRKFAKKNARGLNSAEVNAVLADGNITSARQAKRVLKKLSKKNLKTKHKNNKSNAKEAKKRYQDERAFAHLSEGKYGRQQRKILGRLQEELSAQEQNLVDLKLGAFVGKNAEEINANLASMEGTLSEEQRAAINKYKQSIEYKNSLVARVDRRYEIEAQRNIDFNSYRDETAMAKRNPLAKAKTAVREKAMGEGTDDRFESYEHELELIKSQLAAEPSSVDADNYKERRKLNARKAELEAMLGRRKNWNENNNEENIDKVRLERKAADRQRKAGDLSALEAEARRKLREQGKEITEHAVHEYIRNVYIGREVRRREERDKKKNS